MNGQTIKLLSEYIAEHHRRERERERIVYERVYEQDTNGVEKDYKDNEQD